MRLRLLHDRVLIRLDPLETASRSGRVLLAYLAQDQPTSGTVIAVGPGIIRDSDGAFIPTTLRPGDRIKLGIRPGHGCNIDGIPHVFVHEFSDPQRYPGEGPLAVDEGEAAA